MMRLLIAIVLFLLATPAWAQEARPIFDSGWVGVSPIVEFTSVIIGGVMTINMKDKTITVSPDAKPDEAAQRVIEALRAHIREVCPK